MFIMSKIPICAADLVEENYTGVDSSRGVSDQLHLAMDTGTCGGLTTP
jgi:fluoride ion exporter CrcB/FEX